jgi:hypothetical protein
MNECKPLPRAAVAAPPPCRLGCQDDVVDGDAARQGGKKRTHGRGQYQHQSGEDCDVLRKPRARAAELWLTEALQVKEEKLWGRSEGQNSGERGQPRRAICRDGAGRSRSDASDNIRAKAPWQALRIQLTARPGDATHRIARCWMIGRV